MCNPLGTMLARRWTATSRRIFTPSRTTSCVVAANEYSLPGYAPDYSYSVGGAKRRRAASTFEYQTNMPRLPVPNLEDTVHKYLKSLIPILNEKDFERENDIVNKFCQPGGPGQFLQEGLQVRSFCLCGIYHLWLVVPIA